MWSKQSKLDRFIYLVSTLLVLLTSYLMYDDSVFSTSKNENIEKQIGQIINLNNDVRKKNSKKFFWQSAKSTDSIHEGDSLFTGNDSSVKVKLNEGQLISLKENSLTVFKTSTQGLKLDLQYGRIEGSLNGCLQFETKNKTQSVCGKNSQLDISADGKVEKIEEKIISDQITLNSTPEKFNHLKNQQDLNLKWSAIGNFGRYKVQFSTTPNFKFVRLEQKFQKQDIKTKKYPVSGKHYIRVIGESVKNSNAITSSIISNTISVDFKEVELPVVVQPASATNLMLETNYDNELTLVGQKKSQVHFQWQYSLPESHFNFQLATDEKFSQLVVDQKNQKTLSFKSEPLVPGQYFFRVRDSLTEKFSDSNEFWSKPISLTVEKIPPPILETPVLITKQIDYTIPQPQKISFKWKIVQDAAKYSFEISKDSKFRNKETLLTKKLEYTIDDVQPGEFYFRVFALTEKNTSSLASDIGQARITLQKPVIEAVPSISKLGLSPEDPGSPETLRVQWSSLQNVSSYLLQMGLDNNFTNSTEIKTTELNSEITLPSPGSYSVRVQGIDNEDKTITQISDVVTLQYVLIRPLRSPELLEPLDQLTLFFQKNSSVYVRLKWSAVLNAQEYLLEVATDKEFQNKIISQTTAKNNYQIQSQLPTTHLYWRVMAKGKDGLISNWSPLRTMSVFSGRAPAVYQRKK